MMTTIAYLGPPGTFSEEAAITYGGPDAEFLPLASMPAAVTPLETGLGNICGLPIENVVEGSVTTTPDLRIDVTTSRALSAWAATTANRLETTRPASASGSRRRIAPARWLACSRNWRSRESI